MDIVEFPDADDPIALFFDVIVNVTHEGKPLYYYIGFIEVPSVGSYDLNVVAAKPVGSLTAPNDTYFLNQWNLGITHLFSAQWHPAGAKQQVTIGVIDSGISPMLRGHGGLDGVELIHESVQVGETIIDEHIDVPFSHALGVISLLGDRNQDGSGVVGLVGGWNDDACSVTGSPYFGDTGPEIRSYGVGVLGPVSTAVAAAVYDAIDDGVDVINFGLAIGYSPLVEEAILDAIEAGIVVVAAAGNHVNGSGKPEVMFPASVEGVISVGAVDRRGRLSKFSARHGVDILAPGEEIIVGGGDDVWYEGYGTSYAAPHVTAAAAMMKAANPGLGSAEIQDALQQRASRKGNGGLGVLNAFGSLNQVLDRSERAWIATTPLICGVHAYLTDQLSDLGYGDRAGKAGEDAPWWEQFAYDASLDEDLYDRAGAGVSQAELPQQIGLQGNYPNPFNPTTTVRFNLDRAQDVTLTVYNALGQEVRVLLTGQTAAGEHSVKFDASGLPSGVYVTLLRTEAGTYSSKMVLTK